jgi:hypothetical protein
VRLARQIALELDASRGSDWKDTSDEEVDRAETGAKTFNDATKYVASRSHPRLEWSNSVLIEGDAAGGIVTGSFALD